MFHGFILHARLLFML